jgi:hypothetical protein
MTPKTNLSGTKMLIAAAAISGTFGGWILLSLNEPAGASGTVSIQDPGILDLLNQPMPTLAQPNRIYFGPVVDAAGSGSGSAANSNANPPALAPTLRRVVAPPASGGGSGGAPGAVGVTQSSRK